jgi:hypothetical protein
MVLCDVQNNNPTGSRSVAIGEAKQVSGGKLEVVSCSGGRKTSDRMNCSNFCVYDLTQTFAPPSLNVYAPYWIIGLYGEESEGYRCVACPAKVNR